MVIMVAAMVKTMVGGEVTVVVMVIIIIALIS